MRWIIFRSALNWDLGLSSQDSLFFHRLFLSVLNKLNILLTCVQMRSGRLKFEEEWPTSEYKEKSGFMRN